MSSARAGSRCRRRSWSADQLTKWAVLDYFAYREPREITGFFNLVLVYNKGAAFSFFASADGWQTPLFILFASSRRGS